MIHRRAIATRTNFLPQLFDIFTTIFYKVAVATHNELGKTDQGQHPLGVLLAPHMSGSIWNNPKNLLDHHLFRNHTHQLVSEDHPDAVN